MMTITYEGQRFGEQAMNFCAKADFTRIAQSTIDEFI